MGKIINKKSNITPFGGLFFIHNILAKKEVSKIIDKFLGYRDVRATYKYSDISKELLYNCLCNGEFLADIAELKEQVPYLLKDSISSPDTVEYASQELKVPNRIIYTENNIIHEINYNPKFNRLLPFLAVYLGTIPQNTKGLTLDYDNLIDENKKSDAKKTYKHTYGYQPAFANIGNITVHFENRNGNTPAKYMQKEALEKCFENLKIVQIIIDNFRGDAASYQKDVIELLMQNIKYFYIRSVECQSFRDICIATKEWKIIELKNEKIEVASVYFKPFKSDKEYRYVVQKTLIKNSENEIFEEQRYTYYAIITNDMEKSESEVIQFYNDRGDVSENQNKNLLNDFNLKRLPFRDLATNTVYMGFVAICNILFEWIKSITVKNKVKGVKIKHRVKRFFYKYICVCAKFTKHARNEVVTFYTNRNYFYLQI